MTWTEYQELPDDGRRYEVLEGQLVVTPSPDFIHQVSSKNIEYAMETWRRTTGAGGQTLHAPFDVVLADDDIVQPDVMYLAPSALSLLHKGKLHGAPTVVVEIFNKRGAPRDRVTKLQIYARHQISEYWLVDLESRSITILTLSGDFYETIASGTGDAPLASRAMPGLVVKPRDVFEGC